MTPPQPPDPAAAGPDAPRRQTPEPSPSSSEVFAILERPRRIWAIAAIHGELDRLVRLHDAVAERIRMGDRLVYLGNMLGHGPDVVGTVDELLDFRCRVLAEPGMMPQDIVYLRGAQEEMWAKLRHLHFAQGPAEVLDWMLRQGLAQTLASYGLDAQEGMARCRDGAPSIARWLARVRQVQAGHPGHEELMAHLRRYARCDQERLLFVNAGVDPHRPLSQQADTFWWGTADFDTIARPYAGYRLVVRGFDRLRRGLDQAAHRLSLDAGCGFGGPLLGVALSPEGDVLEVLNG
ncbi:hypothetical protein [Zavarzinia sp. CC-PAN008]|uniref:hypothetical protein n=1 Tax=Zavarzinia sp. CC-PAN008 TaxID=3243332 RepID=UPI003F746D9A